MGPLEGGVKKFYCIWVLWLSMALWAGGGEDDAGIEARLKSKLTRSKLRGDGLQYRVKDGVVEWTGKVGTPQRKGAATRMARSAGARKVLNRIMVNGGSGAAPRRVAVRMPER
ncbi:MAG: BON domain-containing protein [Bryobacter sp.]|nr:BON domain-containing protein [Bryobacter sp. CoA8 C33]